MSSISDRELIALLPSSPLPAGESRLPQAAQTAAKIGMWEWNPKVVGNILSPELHEMFGTTAGPTCAEMWAARVYPLDWPLVKTAMEQAVRTGVMEFEYRYIHPQNGLRWFYCKGGRLAPEDEHLFGIVLDITRRKQNEETLQRSNDDLERQVKDSTEQLTQTNEYLRQSEERFRLLVESVQDYAIFMLSIEGEVLSWNEGAERIKGYRPDEILGRHFSVFYPPEEGTPEKLQQMLDVAAKTGRFETEGWRVRKDGSRFWANVIVTALRDRNGLRGFAKITRDVTERKKSEQAVRELSGRLLKIQDEERRHLARELHDSTGQMFSALSLNLMLVKQFARLEDQPQAQQALSESVSLADQASREIRTLSYLLHPPLLDEAGLLHALCWYVEGFAQRTNIRVNLTLPPESVRFSRNLELALFRVVQEGLTNIHRHSASTLADIHLEQTSKHVILEIRDYGKGFPAEMDKLLSSGSIGVGLRGMLERAHQLGGQIEIMPATPGARVRAVLPLPNEDH